MSRVHPTAIVDARAEIDGDVQIGPYCVIGAGVRIGKGCRVHSHAVITGRTTLGEGNVVFPLRLSVTRRRISNIRANRASF